MKTLVNYGVALLCMALTLVACSSDDATPTPINELQGWTKIQDITTPTHTLELFSASGQWVQGYNEVRLRLKNNSTQQYETHASLNWSPLMHMMNMTHSCPKSEITRETETASLYSGYLVFQMASNASEYWELKIDYTLNGTTHTATEVITVHPSAKRTVTTFTGTDNKRYILALVNPKTPKVALNDFTVALFTMENSTTFPVVNDYTIQLDPRMPSMGNHSSPNNVHAVQTTSGGFYHGKLALTMTGYWKLNLQLVHPQGEILKGEAVTSQVLESSLFLELEF
jgi:hypothetical protein